MPTSSSSTTRSSPERPYRKPSGPKKLVCPDAREDAVSGPVEALTQPMLLLSRKTARTEANLPILLSAKSRDLFLLDEGYAAAASQSDRGGVQQPDPAARTASPPARASPPLVPSCHPDEGRDPCRAGHRPNLASGRQRCLGEVPSANSREGTFLFKV